MIDIEKRNTSYINLLVYIEYVKLIYYQAMALFIYYIFYESFEIINVNLDKMNYIKWYLGF